MVNKAMLALAVVAGLGCGSKKKASEGEGGGDHAGSGSAAVASPMGIDAGGSDLAGSAAMIAPKTDADRANKFEACWALWNVGKFDAYGSCYALDARSEVPGATDPVETSRAVIVEQAKSARATIADQKGALQLVLASGQTVIGLALVTGTFGGKPTGAYVGLVTDFDDTGAIAHEQAFMDVATVIGQANGKPGVRAPVAQVTGHEVVIASHSDAEKANVEIVNKLYAAFDKHDAPAYAALIADDIVWSEAALPKDDNKKSLLASAAQLWTAVPDAKLDVAKTWAAGDYVAAQETLTGTHGGKPVALPMLAIHKLAGGHIHATWLLFEGALLEQQLGGGSGTK